MIKRYACLCLICLLCLGCSATTNHTYQEVNTVDYTFPTSYMIEQDNHFAYQPG